MMDLTCSFFVVSSGKPWRRSKRIWWPKTDNVPVPVRSSFARAIIQDALEQIKVLQH